MWKTGVQVSGKIWIEPRIRDRCRNRDRKSAVRRCGTTDSRDDADVIGRIRVGV